MGSMDKQGYNLCEYIKEARDRKGIKSNWLAEKLEITSATMSYKLEKDRLYAKEFIELVIALDLDANEIIADIKKSRGED